jgi:hypothetical protein
MLATLRVLHVDSSHGPEKSGRYRGRVILTLTPSAVGIMNEFTYLAETYRTASTRPDLLSLSMRRDPPAVPCTARTPAPDRELTAFLHTLHPKRIDLDPPGGRLTRRCP